MTDLELLELAAKAAGVKKDDSPYNGGGFGNNGFDCAGNMMLDWHNNKRWNPLSDDGDALRLVVKCNLLVCVGYGSVSACLQDDGSFHRTEEIKDDPYAATRRAIVRAAAEIGRN